MLFAKDFVSSAASAEPHAALAWAGVSILLPLLLNPTPQQAALMQGLDYASTLILRFTTIEHIYCQQISERHTSSVPADLVELNRSFETQVTKLYSQILSYQAQIVC